MTDTSSSSDNVSNKLALNTLTRAIKNSQGNFSLILACCNSVNCQEEIRSKLKDSLALEIAEITLPPSAETLYTTIKSALDNDAPQALMIYGLESVVAIHQLLLSANLVRDEFGKQFKFPLVLWVNDEILRTLIKLAPDFKNWAANTIRFEIHNNYLALWQAITA